MWFLSINTVMYLRPLQYTVIMVIQQLSDALMFFYMLVFSGYCGFTKKGIRRFKHPIKATALKITLTEIEDT
jgi:hypothetical protein